MLRRKISILAISVAAFSTALVSSTQPAVASPSSIHYGYYHEVGYDPGYVAWAEFYSGSGSIRAYMGCASGNEAWVIYGYWFNKGIESDTDQCASMYTHGYNARSQGGIG